MKDYVEPNANEEEEEESSIITLTDEDGSEVDFEFLDLIEYEGNEYVVLLPVEEDSDEVVILQLEETGDDEESYIGVDDEEVLTAVFEIFKEKYKDDFNFAD